MRAFSALAAVALLPLLGGCIIVSSERGETVSIVSSDPEGLKGKNLETLSHVRFDGQAMSVVVGSNGCTKVSDFEVHIVENEQVEISLVRSTPDLCRAIVPEGVSLSWTYEELGLKKGQSVKLLNPLGT